MFQPRLNILQKLSRYRFCIALYGRSSNKRSNLNELKFDVKFCEIKAEGFQTAFFMLFAKLGVGDIDFYFNF